MLFNKGESRLKERTLYYDIFIVFIRYLSNEFTLHRSDYPQNWSALVQVIFERNDSILSSSSDSILKSCFVNLCISTEPSPKMIACEK